MRSSLRDHETATPERGSEVHNTNTNADRGDSQGSTDESNDEKAAAAKRDWVNYSKHSPRNWPLWKKSSIILGLNFYTILVFVTLTGFVTDQTEEQYGVGEQVAILGQSMFILGVAIGPMFLAPLSEIYGRQPVYTTSILAYTIMQIPTALSPTFAGVGVTRFLTGCVAGLPISNVGATASDLFTSSHTAWSIMAFSFTSQTVGPDLGPVIGSAIYVSSGSIHWLYWLALILGAFTFLWSLTFGETLHDKVYERHTGIKNNKSAGKAIQKELFRAFRLLFTEPIVFSLALTTTYLFGLIFIYLEGFPLVYEKEYNFNATQEGATFLPGIVGGIIAVATQPLQNYLYRRSARFSPDGKPKPEARLYTACVSVWALPISIFWFAFTSTHPEISFHIPMWSGVLFGYAEVATYTGIWQYVTDAYGDAAGSALAACNLPANSVAAALAHLAIPMFEHEGIKWALATLGFISLGFLAVPPLIVWNGAALRRKHLKTGD